MPFLSSFTTSPRYHSFISRCYHRINITFITCTDWLTDGHTPQVSTVRATLPNWTCYGDHKLRPFLRHFFYAAEDDEPIH